MKRKAGAESLSSKSARLGCTVASNAKVLCDWLAGHGAALDGIELKSSDLAGGGLGCFATRPFKAGDTLFVVPKDCLFGVGNVLESDATQTILKQADALGESHLCTADALLWVHMLLHKHCETSPFFHYFKSLDARSPSLLQWPQELLELIDGTNLGSSLQSLHQSLLSISSLLSRIHALDPKSAEKHGLRPAVFTLEELQWACGHYLSRRYPKSFAAIPASLQSHPLLERREQNLGNIGTLVPLLDILNHNDEEEWLRFEVVEQGLQVICNVARDAGQELFSNYGELGNEQLLFAFGFTIPNNNHDTLGVKLKGLPSFAIPSSGVPPAELWQALGSMVHAQGEENADSGLFPREVPGDLAYHHPEEVDILLGFVEHKLQQMQAASTRVCETLASRGVVYSVIPPRSEEDGADGEEGALLSAGAQVEAAAGADGRAVSAAVYLAGQYGILCKMVDHLQQAMDHAMQYQPEEDEEEEEEES